MANFFLVFLLYSQGNCGILRNETRLVVMPSCKATASGQRWQRYKAMASGQRFKATFGALPRKSGMQFLGKDRWLHLERSAPNRRPPTEIFDQQTKSVFGMTPYSLECLISISQDVVFNHQPPASNCRVAHSDWPGPNIWIWHSSFEVENRSSSCCHFPKILGEASGQVF